MLSDYQKHVQNSRSNKFSNQERDVIRQRSKKQLKKMNLQANVHQAQDVTEMSDFTEKLANNQLTTNLNDSKGGLTSATGTKQPNSIRDQIPPSTLQVNTQTDEPNLRRFASPSKIFKTMQKMQPERTLPRDMAQNRSNTSLDIF